MRTRTKVVALGATLLAGAAVDQARRGLRVHRSRDEVAAYWRDRSSARASGGEVLVHVALGDSTAQAVGAAHPDDGYVGRLAADLADEHGRPVHVVNLSATGARVADLVRDQLPALAELLADGTVPALVTVTVGANDTGRTDVADFVSDMEQVLDALPSGSLVADVPYFRGPRGASSFALSGAIRRLVAERPGLVQVDLWIATRGMRPREYAADLFHPSTRGYDRYYRAFAQARDRGLRGWAAAEA